MPARSSRPRSGSTATASIGSSSSICSPPRWRTWSRNGRRDAALRAAGGRGRGPRGGVKRETVGGVTMEKHKVVSHDEWIASRQELLREEKEFTRLRDRLSQRRRDLPWE